MDERDAVLGAGAGEQGRAGRVRLPCNRAALGGLGPVHGGVGAEYRAVGDGDELVPGLGVDAAGDAAAVVVGDGVLDDLEVGDAQGGDGEVLLECDVCHLSIPSYWPCAR